MRDHISYATGVVEIPPDATTVWEAVPTLPDSPHLGRVGLRFALNPAYGKCRPPFGELAEVANLC